MHSMSRNGKDLPSAIGSVKTRRQGEAMTREERIASLKLEFERLRERQDKVHALLAGQPDVWVTLRDLFPDHAVEIVIDKAVSEARQGAVAMATIARTLDTLAADEKSKPVSTDATDELKKRRQNKLDKAARQ